MSIPATDTGRTAEEMREQIAALIEQATYWRIRTGRAEKDRDGWRGRYSASITRLDTALADREAAEAEAAHLRSRLLEAEKGAEAMGWSTDWSAAERHDGDILAGAYSSLGGWRQAVVRYTASIFWDWPFGEKPTHWRHLDKPPALNPNQEAGDHEPR